MFCLYTLVLNLYIIQVSNEAQKTKKAARHQAHAATNQKRKVSRLYRNRRKGTRL